MKVFFLSLVQIQAIFLYLIFSSKFNKLCKSVVSNPKAKCLTPIESVESVKIMLVQCDSFFILSHFSILEI